MKSRCALGRRLVAEGAGPVAQVARVLGVSRQALYHQPTVPRDGDGTVVELGVTPPPLPDGWQTLVVSPETVTLEVALHVLARRHPVAGYRTLCSRLRRAGWRPNRTRIARLLRRCGLQKSRRSAHPEAQGRPFTISAPNEPGSSPLPDRGASRVRLMARARCDRCWSSLLVPGWRCPG